ncbi:MAG: APC family permease [Gammaproteobacteria bacterium]|nr:APC family permease [Gammaproteobacteria bacterium]
MGEQEAPDAAAAADSAHGLRRELGVGSLVLTQILYIVGASWIGVAATVGQGHAALWVAAVVLFFLPLAMLVAQLAQLMPLEGGLYRWSEAAFGPGLGYFVAWNLWCFTVAVLAIVSVSFASALSYALDGYGGFDVENPWHVRIASFGAIAIGAVVVSLGLRIGKWVHNLGGVAHVLAFLTLIVVPFVALANGRLAGYHPLDLAMPAATLFTFNVFSKLAMGAFSGFEYVAILAGECRDPARTIARSVWISTPIIIAMFVLGTCSVVAIVPRDQLDLIAPLPQTLRLGFGGTPAGQVVVVAVLAMVLLRQVANICVTFAGSVRLPMVAAWHGQVPGWLGAVSRRFGSPLHAAVLVSCLVAALTVVTQFGARSQEAFQLLDNAGTVFYGITYVALFSIPLVGRREIRCRIPLPVRLAAVSGLAVTVLSVALSLVPIVHVASDLVFAAKILAVVLVFNLVGLVVFLLGRSASSGAAVQDPLDAAAGE